MDRQRSRSQREGFPVKRRKPARKPRKYRYVYRDAIAGTFVPAAFAAEFPNTTIRQRVRISRPRKPC